MAMTAVGVGVAAVGSYASSKSQQKADARALAGQVELSREGAINNMYINQHAAALDDYYEQKRRVGASRGLEEFRKFNTVQSFAPGYVSNNPGPQMPEMPTASIPMNTGVSQVVEQPTNFVSGPQRTGQGG